MEDVLLRVLANLFGAFVGGYIGLCLAFRGLTPKQWVDRIVKNACRDMDK